jgi:hypothetical protein
MRDIVKDWRRWSRAERLMAVLIVTFLIFGVPLALTLSITSTMPGRQAAGIGTTL